MTVSLGVVDGVDPARRLVRVSMGHLGVMTPFVRIVSPFGLVAPLPAVGEEVLVAQTGPTMADCVVVGWICGLQAAADASGPLVFSTTGSVPRQSDPDQEIGDAGVSGVRTR